MIKKDYYSQNDEEKYIVEYFKDYKNGFLVDIGAYNVFKFSNTRKLFEMGFKCAFVEPSKICFNSFLNEYSNNDNVKLFNFALGNYNGKIQFYDSQGDAISTTSDLHYNKWNKISKNYKKIEVEIKNVNEFLSQFEKIDFISIDVESTNFELFNFIEDKYFEKIKMICIEHDSKHTEIENRLNKFGFKRIHFNGENLIMAK